MGTQLKEIIMFKKFITLLIAVSFVWIQTSVSFAENIHFTAFDHTKRDFANSKINSRGLTGQVGFRIPFGHQDKKSKKAFYGLKLTYGQEIRNSNPFKYGYVRDLNLLKAGFNKRGISSLNFANQNLLDEEVRRNIFGNGNGNGFANGNGAIWGLGAVAIGVGICWAVGCFDGDDSPSSS